jgi:hypothetical protein
VAARATRVSFKTRMRFSPLFHGSKWQSFRRLGSLVQTPGAATTFP